MRTSQDLLAELNASDESPRIEAIFHPRHPIYGMLFELQTLDVVRIIEGQT